MDQTITNQRQTTIVPVMTTPAGSCLTPDNWYEIGKKVGSFNLCSLLLKPGYDLLISCVDLSSYVAWTDTLVLNATMPAPNKAGFYVLCSPYDGSRIQLSREELVLLIRQLKPNIVLLPAELSDCCSQFSSEIKVFISNLTVDMAPSHDCGIYFDVSAGKSWPDLMAALKQYEQHETYVIGHFSMDQIIALHEAGVTYVEIDRVASDACNGLVYHAQGVLSLHDNCHAYEFSLLDAKCTCPTCEQLLTRAYLHHLLTNTPLLCQRFLIQHNHYFTQLAIQGFPDGCRIEI
ncbi:MAG: queuine tRNA-ribosyltransferase [Legionella sp.]